MKISRSLFAHVIIFGLTFAIPCFAQQKVTPQRDWADSIVYFVVLDRFADGDPSNNRDVDITKKGHFHGGDIAGLTQQLDYLAELGITAIWLTPVVKNIPGYVSGVGFPDYGYHGYWADDFYQLDERFGTEAELKKLVEESHARNIKVLLDVVYNHAGYNSAYTKADNANDWLRTGRRESLCGEDDITLCLSGLPDFKTEKPEVADYLLTAQIGLAKRVGLDGFRLDTVKHIDHPFWQTHRDRVDAELGKDFFLLGEVWGGDYKNLDPWFINDEMDAGFDFSFKGSAQAWVQGRGRTIAFSRYLLKRHKVREGYHLSHYLSSHDVPGALYELGGDKTLFKLCAALQMTTFGMPTIYYGEEASRFGGDWPANRSHMPWGDRNVMPGKGKSFDEDMFAYYKKLIQVRREYRPLSAGDYAEVSTEGDMLVFARTHEGTTVWVAVNRAKEAATLDAALPESWAGKSVHEVMDGEDAAVTDGKVRLEVPAQSVHVYVAR